MALSGGKPQLYRLLPEESLLVNQTRVHLACYRRIAFVQVLVLYSLCKIGNLPGVQQNNRITQKADKNSSICNNIVILYNCCLLS